MTVVVNAGPLIALAKLHQLTLLQSLYQRVSLPAAVHDEVVTRGQGGGHSDAVVVERAIESGWLVIVEPLPSTDPWNHLLDEGERQVIQVALLQPPAVVLLDDLAARRAAGQLGLTVRGTVGVLTQAYRTGLLPWSEMEGAFEVITRRDDIWIATALCRQVLDALRQPGAEPPVHDTN